VVRAAVKAWLATSERDSPAQIVEAIRLAIVKRGRKPRERTTHRAHRHHVANP